jgi:hypothetical protein
MYIKIHRYIFNLAGLCLNMCDESFLNIHIVNSRFSGIMVGGKVMDNLKPQLKQKLSKHGTKWI